VAIQKQKYIVSNLKILFIRRSLIMKCENLKIRVRNDITNNIGETIYKNETVTINSIWSNDSNTILSCEIQKDNIIIITKLKNII
jgi:hypothetical protein